jgi:hypothetical protein
VTEQASLCRYAVGVSVSDTTDMAMLGMGPEHLEDATLEIARYLLAMGSRLVYGGDLRPGGFTDLLAELTVRHPPDLTDGDQRAIRSPGMACSHKPAVL